MRRQRETHRDIEWGVGRLQGERTDTERRNKHIPTQKEKKTDRLLLFYKPSLLLYKRSFLNGKTLV